MRWPRRKFGRAGDGAFDLADGLAQAALAQPDDGAHERCLDLVREGGERTFRRHVVRECGAGQGRREKNRGGHALPCAAGRGGLRSPPHPRTRSCLMSHCAADVDHLECLHAVGLELVRPVGLPEHGRRFIAFDGDRLHRHGDLDRLRASDALGSLLFPRGAGLAARSLEIGCIGGEVRLHVLCAPGAGPGLDCRLHGALVVRGGRRLGRGRRSLGRIGFRHFRLGRFRLGRLRLLRRFDLGGFRLGHLGRLRAGGAARLRRNEQFLHQRELHLRRGVVLVQLQRAVVGAAGELCVDVAQVLVRRGVARVRVDGELERRLRLVVVALRGVEHREIVVGLGQFRVVLGEPGEHHDRLGVPLLLGEEQALEEPALRLARLRLQIGVDLLHGRLHLALAVEFLRLAQVVGGSGERAACKGHRQRGDGGGKAPVRCKHRVIIC